MRRLVTAMNGLAGIAIIKQDLSEAVSLYKEALALTEEHLEDFRLDPLLNLHIHHNLTEILPVTSKYSQQFGGNFSGNFEEKASRVHTIEESDQPVVKRQKVSRNDHSNLNGNCLNMRVNGVDAEREKDVEPPVSSQSPGDGCLRIACENIKKKYLSAFTSKLSLAQQDFRKSYTQVSFSEAALEFV